jgi:hypothetical protein
MAKPISFNTVDELVAALKRAQEAHHVFESYQDEKNAHDWARWYAGYLLQEQACEN